MRNLDSSIGARFLKPKFVCCTLVMAGILWNANRGDADVVWIRGESPPRYGWIVKEDEQTVVFHPFGTPKSERQTIDRASIEMLVSNIDKQRLENLVPQDLAAYRDYAEELSAQKSDPTAREHAVRLYLIAAAGSQGEVRQSSLKGLVGLAESDQQRQKWNSLLLLFGTPGQFVREPRSKPSEPIALTESQLALEVVRMVRQGNEAEAARLLGQPAVETALHHWKLICSVEELKRISMLNRPTLLQLHQLLEIELSILNGESKTQIVQNSQSRNWGKYAQTESTISGAIPSFKTVTRFNPENSIFRDGRWIKPE